jgi:hypothetical protein
MKHGQDNNAVLLRTKINTVWETIGNDTPNILANNGKLERILGRTRYTPINLGHELKSKAELLAFIPCACFDEFRAGSTIKGN